MMLKSYYPFYKRLLKLAFPLVLTQAGQTIVHLVDNAMVGRVGTVELAAASFANSVFVIAMVVGIGVFLGITPLVGKAFGAKDELKVASVMKNGLFFSVFITLFLFIATWSLAYLMPYMGQDPVVLAMAIPYYQLITFSLIPFLFFMVLKQIGEGLNNTILAMVATIASNIINVVLNYGLIFGEMGFPELGLVGAGWATLISRIFMPLFLFFAFRWVASVNWYFKLMGQVQISLAVGREMLKIGAPIAGQMLLEVSAFAFSAVMMGWISEVALASHQIAMGLAGFTFMLANGVAMAVTIRVSFQLGQRDYASMTKVVMSSVHLVLVYMAICGIGFLLLRYQLPKIFTNDVAVIKQAAALLLLAAIFQLFDGLQIVCLGILRGFSDVKVPMIIAGISYVIIGIPVSYIFAFKLGYGANGIWYGFVAGLLVASILLTFRIKKMLERAKILK